MAAGEIHIPGVLLLRGPRGDEIPLILDSPHSGSLFPDDFDTAVERNVLRRSEDCFVPELFSAVTAVGGYMLEALFPRTYLDLNRRADEIDLAMIEGAWPLAQDPKSTSMLRGSGLFWRTCYPDIPIYARKLRASEAESRILTYYEPYHARLADLIEDLRRRHEQIWHLDCHSMPTFSAGDKSPEGNGGSIRPMINLGDRNGTSCSEAFTTFLQSCFVDLGYETTINIPYNGAFLTSGYSNPVDGRHSIQVEVRRDLYMDEVGLLPNEGFARLQSDLTRVLRRLRDWIAQMSSADRALGGCRERG